MFVLRNKDGGRAPRHAEPRAWNVETPCFHAGRHGRYRQGAHAGGSARSAHADRSRKHLSSVAASGTRHDRRRRRPAPLHGVGRTDPHRLRRISSLQPRGTAQARRRRRNVSFAHRRQRASLHAGERDRVSGSDRRRRRDGARRLREAAVVARSAGGIRAADDAMGAPVRRGAFAATRRRSSRSCKAVSTPNCANAARANSSNSISRATRSAAFRSARRAKSCTRRRARPLRICRRTSRAT